jgi:hypothetical protein
LKNVFIRHQLLAAGNSLVDSNFCLPTSVFRLFVLTGICFAAHRAEFFFMNFPFAPFNEWEFFFYRSLALLALLIVY